jgi:rubrerythrin
MIMIKRKPGLIRSAQLGEAVPEVVPGARCPQHKCRMCGYAWTGKGRVKVPKECPDCKSRNWR